MWIKGYWKRGKWNGGKIFDKETNEFEESDEPPTEKQILIKNLIYFLQ